jgi:DNA-binding CsgD family transcriptional regulator
MIVISPACADERITLDADRFGGVIEAIGTERYGEACLGVFEHMLDAEHWALFRYRPGSAPSCVATASRSHIAQARENIQRFVARCHRADPSLMAISRQGPQPTWLAKVDIQDVLDRQYRECFEAARVQERLSLFSRLDGSLYQLSIFRGSRTHPYSSLEMQSFATLARLVLQAATRHQALWHEATSIPRRLNLEAIEQLLAGLPGELSRRECEVCARAIAGMTIEGTALDLHIGITSVITYRQRAYQKLGVSRQSELVALVHNTRHHRPEADDSMAA